MEDLIDRQAAIKAIVAYMPSLTTADGSVPVDHDIFVAQEACVDFIQIIHELPSAQPEQKVGKWIIDGHHLRCSACGVYMCSEDGGGVMTKHGRLIDAEWLKESLHNFFTGNFHPISEDDIMAYIDAAPTIETKLSAQSDQKVGEWIEHERAEEVDGFLISNYECSYCHSWERKKSYYCPNCGKKMEE